ncbi:MAG: flagellar basal body rod protein FlgC [Candidatus Eremiobacteraeota bacterium]|nr:flagellar basal body rod protein FlgC [Candidatus Eremiobacteraeota bacterium]
MDNLFKAMDVAATGMSAERFKLDLISDNIANVNTTKTKDGTPYLRKMAVITPKDAPEFTLPCGLGDDEPTAPASGVEVAGFQVDASENGLRYVYDPSHPDAIKEGKYKGYIAMPNINIITEMTEMMKATRAFEANSTIIESAKSMAMKALQMGKG